MKKNIALLSLGTLLGYFVLRDASISLIAGFFVGMVTGAVVSKEDF